MNARAIDWLNVLYTQVHVRCTVYVKQLQRDLSELYHPVVKKTAQPDRPAQKKHVIQKCLKNSVNGIWLEVKTACTLEARVR